MKVKTILKKNNEIRILISVIMFIIVATILATSYAFFTYTKTGSTNSIGTGYVSFSFDDGSSEISKGNAFPVENDDVDNTITKTFSLTGHTTYSEGLRYNIYVVYGDDVSGKTRLRDDVVSFQFVPATDGNGFTNTLNNCSSPTSLTFTNGKALVASGLIKDTTELTTKDGYTIKLWIDSSKISISSTTKRATNAEGNPSLADATSGTTTATRYMRNDTTEPTTITLYPAITSQQGKIIYTTNEFSNSYYSFKIRVEAEENDGTELVYLDTNGGTLSGSNVLYVIPGENYPNLPQPTKAGYTFLGWNGGNLLNSEAWVNSISSVTRGTIYKSSGSAKLTATGKDCYTNTYMTNTSPNVYKIYVNPNTTYTLSWKSNNQDVSGSVFLFYDNYSEKHITRSQNQNSGCKITFTTNADTEYITFRLGVSNSGDEITYYDMKLEEGLTATTYEPYYVDNTVTVTQEKDHVLTAIWQKNS